MRILVIGGSVFVGRAVVDDALAAGARVTVFNRGRSAPAPAGVEQVVGDRTRPDDVEQLAGREFDLVVDTCGYVPVDVATSADLLAGTCDRYVFVSSINAYPGWPRDEDPTARGTHDGDPDASADDVPEGFGDSDRYGWRKVGCERAVERAFGSDRATVLRAGSIAGPDDSEIGRLPWWIDRVARGGEVLVPGSPADPVALVDARDLARFARIAPAGVFDLPGPAGRDTRDHLMTACRRATGSDATCTYVTDERWLTDQGVGYWTEVPLWVPADVGPGVFAVGSDHAAAAGMRWRPLADTVVDTYAWQRAVSGWRPTDAAPGLTAAREAELLGAWHARTS